MKTKIQTAMISVARLPEEKDNEGCNIEYLPFFIHPIRIVYT